MMYIILALFFIVLVVLFLFLVVFNEVENTKYVNPNLVSNDVSSSKKHTVKIYQADNRPNLDFLLLSQKVIKMNCENFGFEYEFIQMDNDMYPNVPNFKTKKVYLLYDILLKSDQDFIMFLDSDAWIHNGKWVKDIINNMYNNKDIHGSFSRDPYYVRYVTYVNSGVFILKVNDFTKNMYKKIIEDLESNPKYHDMFPHDQYYISNFVYENKENFYVFKPTILNTPSGIVVRHNWHKDKKMYDDMNYIIKNGIKIDDTNFDIKNNLNTKGFKVSFK